MLERVTTMLRLCDSDDRTIPPTDLFNEGWLLRCLLHWLAENPRLSHPLAVPLGRRWYSEALLATQFFRRPGRDDLWESHTHADGVVGDFTIGNTGEGDLRLDDTAEHFVVIEAKLASGLAERVTNAPGYDQAARTVACMAHALSVVQRHPSKLKRLAFYLVAPASQIDRGLFCTQMSRSSIAEKVTQRVRAYKDAQKTAWLAKWFEPTLCAADIDTISWEHAIAEAVSEHSDVRAPFDRFYDRCLQYNGLKDQGQRA